MTELERNALMGNAVAQKECTEKGIVLPCPFCGGTGIDQGVVSSGILKGSYYFQCEDCGREITVNASEHLLSTWNTRAAPSIGRCGECKSWVSDGLVNVYGRCEKYGFMRKRNKYCSAFEPKQT